MFSWTVVLLVVITAVANLLGGIIVVSRQWTERTLNYVMGFGAGFLLAIAMLDLIPEGLAGSPENGGFILLGFLALFAFQKIMTTHFHFGYETHHDKLSDKTAGIGAFVGMTIHSFFDGVSIAAGFEVNGQLGFLVFMAVLLHKIPDGLTISSLVLAAFNDKKKAFLAALILACSTMLGSAFIWGLTNSGLAVHDQLARVGLSFSAGIFLYVAATDLLPEMNKLEDRKIGLFVLLGVVVFYVASLLVRAVGI